MIFWGNILKSLIHPRVKLKPACFPNPAERLISTSIPPCQAEQKFAVASLYHLTKIDEVPEVIKSLKPWLRGIQATGRFQINAQGVNCQLCFKRESHVDKFKTRLSHQLGIDSEDLRVKVHLADFSVFKRLRVKQKLLEYLEDDADLEEKGRHLNREEWNKKLDSEGDALVLDIRNDYEWDVGRFKQAERPRFTKFKEFPRLVEEVVDRVRGQEERPVMMYCTGGIRCEVFSSLLVKAGVKNVFQLEDGVLGYGAGSVEDTRHWEGNLFVFDDRLVVPIDGKIGGEKDKPVSKCQFCGGVSEMVYNCNSLKCNKIFLSCTQCAADNLGCCSEVCRSVTSADQEFVARNSRQWRGKLVGRGEHYIYRALM